MVDAHSKWIEAHIMSNITAPTSIDKLRQVFAACLTHWSLIMV